MTVTDIIIIILSILFLIRGASRGFINSLIGPFSTIVTSILSIFYYQATEDMVASLLIGLIGPLLLTILLKFLLKTWTSATNRKIKPNSLSRLLGALLTFAWGWVFIIFTLILLTVLPPWGETLTAIHKDVSRSYFSNLVAQPLEKTFFAASKENVTAVVNAASSPDAKSLSEDPRFQTILQDPDIQKEINDHDISKLMNNPKMMDFVQQIMNDPAAMKKVMAIYNAQTQSAKTP